MNLGKLTYNSLVVLLMIISGIGYSQEQLRPLSGNVNSLPVNESKHQNKKTTSLPSLQLPFFDDFSYAYIEPYPSANNWIDSNTYVNTGFAIAPISLGVATFDGLNKKGFPYNMSAPVSYSGVADILTSRPINLKSIPTSTSTTYYYSPADSIFLSFYYQAEGFGEAPEPNDSLCLDFFKPRQNKWTKVWGRAGYNPSAIDTNFYRVRVPVADTAYCDSLFKFRFRNNATISGSLDHWNLDNVQMKQDYKYEDTLANNLVFVYKPSSFLKNYSVIPYRQYDTLEMAARFKNYIRNNFIGDESGNYIYTVTDGVGAPVPTDPLIIFNNPGVKPFFGFGYDTTIASKPIITIKPFAPTFTAPTFYTIKHVITNSLGGTNFLTHVQKFSNYYAYDDCTAEQGYYLNTYGAKAALRFTLNVPDTLKSVRIYFDPIVDGALVQGSGFRLMVWSSSGGVPGTLLYKDSLMYPTYLSGSHNLFPTYNLTSCLPLGVGSYFIGIQQITNKALNIGFDRNTNHMNALYYDIGNGWVQSAIPGSLMINPIMGCTDNPLLVGVSELAKSSVIKIYPNPAQNNITVNFPGNQLETADLEITTALGQTVFTKSIISNEQIDISNLSNGLYFIHLKGNSLNISSQKLIISR